VTLRPLPPGVVALVRLPVSTEHLMPVVAALQAAYPDLRMAPGPDDGHVLLVERGGR
jgi:DNA-binding transcriptional LysR family regulator